ncbi:MAG: fibronectin type III domain-containing protein [Ruminiclostridium sp.]
MKLFKKIMSCFLAGTAAVTMLCAGTVSAGAEKISPYNVSVYENEYYNLLIYTIWFSESEREIWNNPKSYTKTCNEGHNYGIRFDLVFEDGKNRYCMSATRHGENLRWWFFENGNGVDGVVKLESSEAGWEYGIAFTVPLDSPYASKLKKCTKVYGINCMVYCCDEKGCQVEHADSTKGNINYGLVSYVEETNELLGNNIKKSIGTADIPAVSDMSYTGKSKKPAVTVSIYDFEDGKTHTLKKGVDYTITYSDNKDIGYGVITITGKGNYTGTKSLNFRIVPKKTTLKVKKSGSKATLSWDKVKGADKYEVYCSTNGGKYKKISTVSGSKTSYTVSKLDFTKNTYKFRIRSYTTADGEKFYSPYSAAATA